MVPKPNQRVIVVDDDEIARQWTSRALEAGGFEVRTTDSIWIAPLINEFDPAAILMDVQLAGHDGAQLTSILKRAGTGHRTRIILYSGLSAEDLEELAAESGADGYIQKGTDPATLRRQLSDLLTH